jgi:multidrug resistance efflux pump
MTLHPRSAGLLRASIVLTVGAGLLAAALRFNRTTAAQATDVRPPAARSEEGGGVVCFGTVDLEHGISALDPLQPGRVAEILVAEGEQVARGADLLRLEDGMARSRLAEATSGVELARLHLAEAQKQPAHHRIRIEQQRAMRDAMHSRVESARRVMEREDRLRKSAVITDSDRSISQERLREVQALERAEEHRLGELEAQDLNAQIHRAEIELQAAQARLRQGEQALEDCRLKAPAPGTVLRILVAPGDVAGGRPGEPALLFAADVPRVIRATVEQEFAGRVKEGDPASVRDEADPSASWRGRVGRVAGWYSQRRTILHDPSQMSDVRTLECLVVLDPGQPQLRLGQSVRVFIGEVSP